MSKVVLTGGFGFIGSNLYKELKNHFKEVTSIEEGVFQAQDWKEYVISALNDSKPDAIFHVGACSDTLETDVNYMMTRNYEFTKILVDWCVVNKKPIIYSSSAANYGDNSLYPSNLYGWSKYVAENYVVKSNGIALRYFNVYGPGEEHKGKMASVAFQMWKKHKEGKKVQLFPNKPFRDFIYVKDVVSANLFALKKHYKLKGKYYDVGTGVPRLFEDVLDILELPYDYTNENAIPEGYQYYTCADKDKMMPGWEPKYDLEKGLEEYKEYLCKNT